MPSPAAFAIWLIFAIASAALLLWLALDAVAPALAPHHPIRFQQVAR